MAMTLEEVKKYIDAIGGVVAKEMIEDDISIVAFSKYNNTIESKYHYAIYLRENGELIQFNNSIGSSDIGGVEKSVLLEALLHNNAETKFGTWEYDKEQDEIEYTVEIPLEDNTLTEKQFKRIMKVVENGTISLFQIINDLRKSTESSDGI